MRRHSCERKSGGGVQAAFEEERRVREATEEELQEAIAKLEAQLRVDELGEELTAATEALNASEGRNTDLERSAAAIKDQYLSAQARSLPCLLLGCAAQCEGCICDRWRRVQDTVEAEQNVVMKMQREITRLKSVEIDNEYLNSENRKIKGELKELSGNLSSTRRALEQAKADAEAQRQKSEATLSQLQVALDDIQEQVMSVVDEDGGTQVLSTGGNGAAADTPPPPPVVNIRGDVAPAGNGAVKQEAREPVSASGRGREP